MFDFLRAGVRVLPSSYVLNLTDKEPRDKIPKKEKAMLFDKFFKTLCISACYLTLTGCAGLGDVLVGVVQAAEETSKYMEQTNPQ